MKEIIERGAAPFFRWSGQLFGFGRVAKGDGGADVPIGGEAEKVSGLIGFVDGGHAGADTEIPGHELHVGGGLTGVKHDGPTLGGVEGENGDAKGSPGHVPGIDAEGGHGFEALRIADGDEVPGLHVLGALGATSGVDDLADDVVGDGLGGEVADGAFGADGVLDVHGSLKELVGSGKS